MKNTAWCSGSTIEEQAQMSKTEMWARASIYLLAGVAGWTGIVLAFATLKGYWFGLTLLALIVVTLL